MKTPNLKDLRAPSFCNPLALRLSRRMRFMWPAISMRNVPVSKII